MTKPLNRAKCNLCQSVIVSTHQHDFVSCACGAIYIDGGNSYWRAGAKDFKNLLRFKNRKWTPIEFNNEPVIKSNYLKEKWNNFMKWVIK